jgi:hypothetical protein
VYQALPKEFRGAVKSLLKDTIRGLVNSPIVDPVLDVIGGIAGALDDVVDDVRSLDPHEPLVPQLLELVLSRIEDDVRDRFGSTKPRINVGFGFSYEFFGHRSVWFDVGRVDIPFSTFFGIIRDVIKAIGAVEDALDKAAADLATAFAKQFDIEDKEEEKAGKQRDQDRLSRIDREHAAIPKEVAVLSPASASVHGGDVAVEIHLGRVPLSYLGLDKDEQQRVFILVNGEMVPPKTLVVGAAAASADPTVHTRDIRLEGLPGFDAGAQVFRGDGATIRVGGDGSGAAAPTALARASGPGIERRVGTKKGSRRPVTSSTLANVLPGRFLPPSRVRALGASLPPGIEISFTIARKDLVQGANTLAVIVCDRGGRRYEQVVSFGVSAPPAPPRPGAVVTRLPIRKGGRGGSADRAPVRGVPVKPAVGAGAAPSALKQSLARSREYVKSQAGLNLATRRGKPR